MSDEGFIGRWSRLKRGAREEPAPAPAPVAPAAPPDGEAAGAASAGPQEPPPLPDPDTLEPGAEISAFMRDGVDEALKRRALKTLFQDPRFNIMDGLDVYIDDYSKPDPLPEGWLEKMNQVTRLGEYRDPEEKASRPEGESDAAATGEAPASLEEAPMQQGVADESAPDGESLAAPPGADAAPVERGDPK